VVPGPSRTSYSDSFKANVVKLVTSGKYTISEAITRFDTDRANISRWIKDSKGIKEKSRNRKIDPQDPTKYSTGGGAPKHDEAEKQKAAIQYLKGAKSREELGLEYKVHPATIYRWAMEEKQRRGEMKDPTKKKPATFRHYAPALKREIARQIDNNEITIQEAMIKTKGPNGSGAAYGTIVLWVKKFREGDSLHGRSGNRYTKPKSKPNQDIPEDSVGIIIEEDVISYEGLMDKLKGIDKNVQMGQLKIMLTKAENHVTLIKGYISIVEKFK